MTRKSQQADPTHSGNDIVAEEITVSASDISGGSVDITFSESYSSAPHVIPVARYSVESGVTVEDGTKDTSGCTLLSESNECNIDVLVIRA